MTILKVLLSDNFVFILARMAIDIEPSISVRKPIILIVRETVVLTYKLRVY